MPTLIVASRAFADPAGGAPPLAYANERRLIAAAEALGWSVRAAADPPGAVSEPAVYVSTDRALELAAALGLELLEPPLDLLTRVPERFLRRPVELATFADLERLQGPTFVKPADPLDKWFDAGVYADVRDIRTRGANRPDAPVLLSGVVEWSVELRYFVHAGRAVAGSPYLSYGRPAWRYHPNAPSAIPPAGLAVVEGVCAALADELPPAFVLDVGRIDDRGWAVVEFNPIWSAGLLNADPRAVLPALLAATSQTTAAR